MSLNYNECIYAGRLTADPELKLTSSGLHYTKFTVAVDRPKNKEGNSATDFIPIAAWREKADFITNYFHKGSPIFVRGTMQSGSYTDKEGNKRTSLECLADEVKFVESKAPSGEAPAARPTTEKPVVTTSMDIAEGGEADNCPF